MPDVHDAEVSIVAFSSPSWASQDRIEGWVYGGDTVRAEAKLPAGANATYEWFEEIDEKLVATGVGTPEYATTLTSNRLVVRVRATGPGDAASEQFGVTWVNRAIAKTGIYKFENKPVVGERLYWSVATPEGLPLAPYRIETWITDDQGNSVAHSRPEGRNRFSTLVASDWATKTIKVWAHGAYDESNQYFGFKGRATGSGILVPEGTPKQGKVNLPSTMRVGDRFKASLGTGWAEAYVDPQVRITIDGVTHWGGSNLEWDLYARDLGKRHAVEISVYNEADRRTEIVAKRTYTVALGAIANQKLYIGSEGKTHTASAKVGTRLHASPQGGQFMVGEKQRFQWLRNGKAIVGATRSTYVPVGADFGKRISYRATTSAPGYTAKTQTSIYGTKITAARGKAGKVSVSGTKRPGKVLKAKTTVWASGAKLDYQWMRNGKKIKGATKPSYKLSRKDASKRISVKVTSKRLGYTTVSKTSASTRIARR